ncbi:Malonyl-CoA:anthocyanidin 5-O-glucoside-6''-O-malonyltransferase, partial [Linum perenne]
ANILLLRSDLIPFTDSVWSCSWCSEHNILVFLELINNNGGHYNSQIDLIASTEMTTRVIEICHVAPSPPPAAEFTVPLTFFDTFWLKLSPVERIFFYRFPSAAATSPVDVIIPRLKRSLSLALHHFPPLAGKLIWPEEAEIPFILCSQNDGVSFTVAESTVNNFDVLLGDGPTDASLSRACLPKLVVSRSKAAVLAVQVTVFTQGFCIGVTSHHAVLDGKSSVMFLKAWAHISKEMGNGADGGELTEELTPFVDRTVVKDPDGIALEVLKTWMAMNSNFNNPTRSLEFGAPAGTISNQVRGILKLSRQDINKLKERIQHCLENDNHDDYQTSRSNKLSTFVVTFTHTLVCIAKAKDFNADQVVFFGFPADCRSRLNPPLPSNYFGNCVIARGLLMKIGDIVQEDGIARVARTIIEAIKKLDHDALDGAKGRLASISRLTIEQKGGLIMAGVAGSPRFGVYEIDFGFGKPKRVEITSIDGSSAMSMAESGDGSGGIEVGVAMLSHEMEKFTSLFFGELRETCAT